MDGQPFGFGLMQQGGSFGGPLAMQRARDPRYAYAQALMRGGADTSPVQTPVQGLARVGSGLVGAWMAREAGKDWDNRESNRAMAIANALKDASGTPAETKAYGDGTTINWDERKPNFQAAISGLAANPDTADMAMRMGMDERQYQRGRADKAADVSGERGFMLQRDQIQNEYGRARDDLSRAHAMFMQDRSAANQAALQGAQQRFTAAENAAQRLFLGQQQTNAQTFQQGQQDRGFQQQRDMADVETAAAGPRAQAATAGQLAAQLAPTTINGPQGPMQVPSGAAAGIAKELSGGNLTQDQSNAATFADRMANANAVIGKLEGINAGPSGGVGAAVAGLPIVGNALSSADRQQFDQAKRDFINAQLRKESGATIQPSEFESAEKQYFPQVGDSPQVIEQKRVARQTALGGMARAAGPSYRGQGTSAAKPPSAGRGPSVGAVEDGYRFKGGNPSDPASWEQVK